MSKSTADSIRLLRMPLRNQQDVVVCRQRARMIVGMLGVENAEQVRIATAVSEIARNAVEYAGGGVAEFHLNAETSRFWILVIDQGPGIPHLSEVMDGRYQSPGGLGCGITGAKRLVDHMEVETGTKGTTIRLEKRIRTAGRRAMTKADIRKLADRISESPTLDPHEEMALQNRELTLALQEAQSRKEEAERRMEELRQLTAELRETNQGVLALYDELDSLHRLSRVISAQLDLDSLVRAIIEATTELCSAEFGIFLYAVNSDRTFRSYAVSGILQECSASFETVKAEELFGNPNFNTDVLRIDDLTNCEHLVGRVSCCGLRSYLAVPAMTADQQLIGVLVFGHREPYRFSERSERIMGATALQAAVGMENARLYTTVQQSSAAKDHFLATLSHELRTPLNPIFMILAEMSKDLRLPADVRSDVQIVQRNLNLEARLIDDLLDMTKIVRGKIYLDNQTIDIHEVVQSACQACTPIESAKGLDLEIHLNASKRYVTGDSTRLQQVLWNLLNNAIKFTPHGGKVTVSTMDLPESERIRIQVQDSGRGIDGTMLGQIFHAFEQGEISEHPEFGGLGLGLAISKHIVEAHRGEISAISEGRDKGAIFTVDLPVALARTHTAAANPPHDSVSDPPVNMRILLVDDHVDTLSVLGRVLTRRGYQVFSAQNAASAMNIAETEPIDVLISDIGLPDGSGLDLMKALQKSHQLSGIALSGYGTETDIARSKEAGFFGHLTKPIDLAELERILVALMAKPQTPTN